MTYYCYPRTNSSLINWWRKSKSNSKLVPNLSYLILVDCLFHVIETKGLCIWINQWSLKTFWKRTTWKMQWRKTFQCKFYLRAYAIDYQRLIRHSHCFPTTIRLDLGHGVVELSTFMYKPRLKQWNAAMNVLRYLAGLKYYGIELGDCSNDESLSGRLAGYCDSNYGTHLETWKSRTCHLFLLNEVWHTREASYNQQWQHVKSGHNKWHW